MNKKRWNRENKTASKKFLKEKKIVYSMERLAVRAVNDSKADRENKTISKKILEREKNSLFNGEIGGKSGK